MMNAFIDFLGAMAAEIIELTPYLMAGIFIEALIRTYKWHIKIKNTIRRFGIISIFIATFLGLISPLCACGVLPLSLGLFFGGVPFSTVMALVVSSPLLSPAGYTLTQWELGTEWALAKTFAAAFMGLYAGLVTYVFENRFFRHDDIIIAKNIPHDVDFHDPDFPIEELRCDCHKQMSHRVEASTKNKFFVFLAKSWEGTLRIGKFFLIGVFFEILVMKYVPSDWIAGYLGGGSLTDIVVVALFSVPLYVNQVTATAILYGLLEKGISKGAGLAFLIGGPVTAIPVMAVFITLFRKRVFFYYVFICLSGTVFVSSVYQWLFG